MGYPISWAPLHVPKRGRIVAVIAPYKLATSSLIQINPFTLKIPSLEEKKESRRTGSGRLI